MRSAERDALVEARALARHAKAVLNDASSGAVAREDENEPIFDALRDAVSSLTVATERIDQRLREARDA